MPPASRSACAGTTGPATSSTGSGSSPPGPLNVYNYLGFSYVGALPQGRLAMTKADLGTLKPGRYVAGLFLDDGYSVLARTSFRVER